MKVWVTAWLFTAKQVEECELAPNKDCSGSSVFLADGRYVYGKGKNWHTSLEGARGRAKEMIGKKARSLTKQQRELQKLADSLFPGEAK